MSVLGWFQVHISFFIFSYSASIGFLSCLARHYWRAGRRLMFALLAACLAVLLWRFLFWFLLGLCWPHYYPYVWAILGLAVGVLLYRRFVAGFLPRGGSLG